MILSIVVVLIGAYVLYFKFKEYKSLSETYSELLSNKKYEMFNDKKQVYILYSLLSFFGAISVALGYQTNELSTALMGGLVILMSISEFITAKFKHVYYYNDTNFIIEGKTIRYKSIKNINQGKKFPFSSASITTLSNESYSVSKKFAKFLLEKKKNR